MAQNLNMTRGNPLKQLFFFSAAVSGDTWTLEDAGFHLITDADLEKL